MYGSHALDADSRCDLTKLVYVRVLASVLYIYIYMKTSFEKSKLSVCFCCYVGDVGVPFALPGSTFNLSKKDTNQQIISTLSSVLFKV